MALVRFHRLNRVPPCTIIVIVKQGRLKFIFFKVNDIQISELNILECIEFKTARDGKTVKKFYRFPLEVEQ